MDTKAFEVLIHSQYAFEACRQQVYDFEDCRQTDSPIPKDPYHCKAQSRKLVDCYREAERLDPLCLDNFNVARECLFKSDGNLYNCKPPLINFTQCQLNPTEWSKLLEVSTDAQKKPITYNFNWNTGYYDRFM